MDSIRIKGMADVSVRDKNGQLNMSAYNTISSGAKRRMLVSAIGELLRGHKSNVGDKTVQDTMSCLTPAYDSSYQEYVFKTYNRNKALSCCLINLTDAEYQEIAGSNYSKSYLPLLTSGCLVDANKVKAFANILQTNPENGVEGYGINTASAVENLNLAAKKFVFPAGVGNGTSTGIAMLPASWKPGKVPSGGVTIFKEVEYGTPFDTTSFNVNLTMPGLLSNPDLVYIARTTDPYWVNVITGEKVDDFGETPLEVPYTTNYATFALLKANGILYETLPYGTNFYTYYNNNGVKGSTSRLTLGNSRIAGSLAYNANTGKIMDIAVSQFSGINTPDLRYSYAIMNGTTRESYDMDLTLSSFLLCVNNYLGIDISGLGWVDNGAYIDSRIEYIIPQTIMADTQLTALIVGMKLDARDYDTVETVFIFNSTTCNLSTLVDIIPVKQKYDMLWGNSNGHYGLVRLGKSTDYTKSVTVNSSKLCNTTIGSDSRGAGTVVSSAYIYNNYNVENGASKILIDGTNNYKMCDAGIQIAHEGMWYSWISCLKMPTAVDKTDETTVNVEYKYTIQ